uniref:ABC transporter related protein n=1 Tax=uncultured bacterium contig00045 TaxID=1181531 RepID=A0A806JZM0_9BACT|nr:ABC transporter related protein [uncultured bacterium contig00045]
MADKIIIDNLTVQYSERGDKNLALDGVTFSVPEGQFLGIVGSSGCGKSTLLSVLMGLRDPSGGVVAIDGKPVSGPGPDRGVVFQHNSLFPWMTARANVVFGIAQSHRGSSKREIRALADDYLAKVGLSDAAHRYPSRLSGGMQQRVAIARTLAMGADILLMDEPFGAVDAKNRVLLQELLLDLWSGEAKRKTVIFVTHDLDEAIFLSDRIIMLTDSPGRVHRDIKVEFPRPRYRDEMMGSAVYADMRKSLFSDFFGSMHKTDERDSFAI